MSSVELPLSSMILLVNSVLVTMFLVARAWKNHYYPRGLAPLVNFGVVVVLPVLLVATQSIDYQTADELFLAGFLFYATICTACLLFPYDFGRILYPVTMVFLCLGVLQSLMKITSADLLSKPALFGFGLIDDINFATFSLLLLGLLVPIYREFDVKLNALLFSRRVNNLANGTPLRKAETDIPLKRREAGSKDRVSGKHGIRDIIDYLRAREYRQCLESCDAEIERRIMARLFQFYPARLTAPMTLEEQLSKLASRGLSIESGEIMKLRKLRNDLAISSGEATHQEARWAIRVLRDAIRSLPKSKNKVSQSVCHE